MAVMVVMVVMEAMVDSTEGPMALLVDSQMTPSRILKAPFLEFLVVTTQSILRFLPLPSSVTARWMVVTMLTLRQIAKLSISALGTVLEVWPSTVSSVPTGLCLTSSTSSAIGGSMLTVARLSLCTP